VNLLLLCDSPNARILDYISLDVRVWPITLQKYGINIVTELCRIGVVFG